MPGYQQYQKMPQAIPGAVKIGSLGVTWTDGKTFEYVSDGKRYRYDVSTRTATEIGIAEAPAGRGGRGGGAARRRLPSADGSSIRRHRRTAGRRPSIAIATSG